MDSPNEALPFVVSDKVGPSTSGSIITLAWARV